MKHLHKMMVDVHPIADRLVDALILKIRVKNQPDSTDILTPTRQLPITDHCE